MTPLRHFGKIMVPQERELVKRMDGRPFVLLGVNGDDDRAEAIEIVMKEGVTWPSIWNGGRDGGIVERMGVKSCGGFGCGDTQSSPRISSYL